MRKKEDIFFAGQITGVEGYTASAATGIVAGINAVRLLTGEPLTVPPTETMIGSLIRYITSKEGELQPMNPVFGLLPPLEKRIKDRRKRKEALAERSLEKMAQWVRSLNG